VLKADLDVRLPSAGDGLRSVNKKRTRSLAFDMRACEIFLSDVGTHREAEDRSAIFEGSGIDRVSELIWEDDIRLLPS
jgi:hypothetical protein